MLAQRLFYLVVHIAQLGFLAVRTAERLDQKRLALIENALGLIGIKGSIIDQVRLSDDATAPAVHLEDGHDDAVPGQCLPITQHHAAGSPPAQPIDIDGTSGYALGPIGPFFRELQDVAVLHDKRIFLGNTHGHSDV